MSDQQFLEWPFFEDRHRDLSARLEAWCNKELPRGHADVDATCVQLVRDLGKAGFLEGTAGEHIDVRSLCLIRETLARHDGLADFAFAMQGLGTGAISLFGSDEQKQWLDKTRRGEALSAFALSEPRSGSDVAQLDTTAKREGDGYRLNGEKTWISNGGIADIYTVFARTGEGPGAKGLSAFLVPATTPGLEILERLETVAPHPLARLGFNDMYLPESALIGKPGQGFVSLWRCWMCFVQPLGQRRWASPAGRWMNHYPAAARVSYLAHRFPIYKWFRVTWLIWR